MTAPDQPDQPDEPYAVWMGSVALVCQQCGALIHPSDTARDAHTAWHAATQPDRTGDDR